MAELGRAGFPGLNSLTLVSNAAEFLVSETQRKKRLMQQYDDENDGEGRQAMGTVRRAVDRINSDHEGQEDRERECVCVLGNMASIIV